MTTTFGSIAILLSLLGLQVLLARHQDRTLPKAKRIPVYMRGPLMMQRRNALLAYPVFSGLLGLLLLSIAIRQDLDPGPRSDGEMMFAVAFPLVLFTGLQLLNGWRVRRWFTQGKPRLD